MEKKYRGFLVSHTHWDRAWYLPFQNYRLRLVRLVDSLLFLLENNSNYKSFLLDGQTVILDDYSALNDQNRERISALVKSGRLSIGPWYTLPDLFLPCGESIIRNLQIGQNLSREFGQPLDVGYVPDPFGHFAQLPQVLNGFGISSFLFMRGADTFIEDTGSVFNWRAPNGSSVLAVYMRDGYLPCSALGHPSVFGRFDGHEPVIESARTRISDAVSLLAPLQQEKTLLLPNGCDHMPPQPSLPAIIQQLNDSPLTVNGNSEVELVHGSLSEFLSSLRSEECEHKSFEGDLIGNLHHPILLSVYSTRMYLKQQNRKAENLLLRVSESLSAFCSRIIPCPDSKSFFHEAWKLLLKNQAHDNICGCSVDSVHREDEVRFTEVCDIATTITTEVLECLVAEGIDAPTHTGELASNVFVFNPHPFPVRAMVRAAVLFANPGGEWALPTTEKVLAAVNGKGKDLAVVVEKSEERVARSAFLETTWGRRYHLALEVDLPALGYDILHVFETQDIAASKSHVDNSFCKIALETSEYRVSVEGGDIAFFDKLTGMSFPKIICFEYEIDCGDTYSFSTVTGADAVFSKLQAFEVVDGLHSTVRAQFSLRVPKKFEKDQIVAQAKNDAVTLDIEVLISSSPMGSLDFEISYHNHASDGRLRALFPVGFAAQSLKVDGHFRVAERSVPPPKEPVKRPYPGETPYDTFHQGEYAFAEQGESRTWLANRGNPEISVAQIGNESWFAVTLHRAVGSLSVYGGSVRQCQAGPEIPTPEAQCLREFRHYLSWGTGKISREELRRRALAFSSPVYAQEMPYLPHFKSGKKVRRSQSFLQIDNLQLALDSCKPWCENGENGISIRLHNLSGEPQDAVLQLGVSFLEYCVTDLNELWNQKSARMVQDGKVCFAIRPFEIGTVIVK